jgi:hypothetical protein
VHFFFRELKFDEEKGIGDFMGFRKIQLIGIIIVVLFLLVRIVILPGIDNALLNNVINYTLLGIMAVILVLMFIFRYRP